MTTTRPYFNATGNDLVALILAGDKVALAEASHRSSRKVQAAARTMKARKATTPKATTTVAKVPTLKTAAAAYASKRATRGSTGWWNAYREFTALARAKGADLDAPLSADQLLVA